MILDPMRKFAISFSNHSAGSKPSPGISTQFSLFHFTCECKTELVNRRMLLLLFSLFLLFLLLSSDLDALSTIILLLFLVEKVNRYSL